MDALTARLLEEGPGPLDRALGELLARLDGRPGDSARVALAAVCCSLWRRHRHACLPLEDLAGRELGAAQDPGWGERAPLLDEWIRILRASPVVARPDGEPRPLVLDGGRLYLERMWRAETAVVDAVAERLHATPATGLDPSADPLERAAAVHGLVVLHGGPGSGKTTAVARWLGNLLASRPSLAVRLAAPTGKAAARLQESLARQAAMLPSPARERLAALPPAATLHRLLLERSRAGDAEALDWLVVDEASMADLPLAARLLESLPVHCRLLLVGDPDQLASVEAGAVLGELCRGLAARPAEGDPSPVVRLTGSHRFTSESGIAGLARQLLEGGADLPAWLSTPRPDLEWWRPDDPGLGERMAGRLETGYQPLLAEQDPSAALAARERFRVLCGARRGRFGVDGFNSWCQRRWRGGPRPVVREPLLVTANDARLGVFNGDDGLLEGPAGEGARCLLPGPAGPRSMLVAQLPGWAPAWALTVHQSQGSEWDEVLLVLPEAPSPLLCRELLYTGLTRARRRLVLVASPAALELAAGRQGSRHGGLAARVAAACPATPNLETP